LTGKERADLGIETLPGSLIEAIQELNGDKVILDSLGPVLIQAFLKAKLAEWEDYRIKVSDWELERYLELA